MGYDWFRKDPPVPPAEIKILPQRHQPPVTLSDLMMRRTPAPSNWSDVVTFAELTDSQRQFGEGEADEADLVMGALIGLRRWALRDGELYPVSNASSDAWTPGENVAKCRRRAQMRRRDYEKWKDVLPPGVEVDTRPTMRFHLLFDDGQPVMQSLVWPCDGIKHSPRCPHGFYAHTGVTGMGEIASTSGAVAVMGAIDGYGDVRVGTRGFIAEKAKIRLLVRPPVAQESTVETGTVAELRQIVYSDQLQRIADRYEVPLYDSWRDAVAEDGALADMLRQAEIELRRPSTSSVPRF